ncbi:MAG: WecB/TagA/CpsF family glycosyltransferase [Candidatus Thiodiazotropha sp. (ex Lucinoma borealis)]|nr:WecB/TagA/CpsF family glycosyltransferase [Candidatus Thiodiazotropha sp. (ex Lucinoma borealis)]
MKSQITSFGINIDSYSMSDSVAKCIEMAKARNSVVPYVVTPNVDHIVNLQNNERLKEAYYDASLVLVDGKPVKAALRLLGESIPEVVPGSDLIPAIFHAAHKIQPISVYLLGAAEGVADKAKLNIERKWNGVNIVGCYSPPIGFENDEQENYKIVRMINDIQPDILVIGLGSPKQEIWIWKNQHHIKAGIALCVGATIDFLAGEVKRAPIIMRKLSLEWLYRIYTDPRRLLKRYLYDAMIFPGIVWKEWKKSTQND